MKFENPVFEAKFIKRYKRFFADVEIDGETVVAHCPNTGSMKTCIGENIDCVVTKNDDPKRKLKYTLELTKPGKSWVGVNTGRPNKMVEELFHSDPLEHWKKYDRCATEIKINDKSRIDLILWSSKDFDGKKPKVKDIQENKGFHFIEVKNVTLKEGDKALFPDSVTTRGQKHLEELMELIDDGHSSEILFTVQRNDVNSFSPASEIDPKYSELLREANKKGVFVTPLKAKLNLKETSLLNDTYPVNL